MIKKSSIGWKVLALKDPNLSHQEWMLIKLGSTTWGDLLHIMFLKIKYRIRGIRES